MNTEKRQLKINNMRKYRTTDLSYQYNRNSSSSSSSSNSKKMLMMLQLMIVIVMLDSSCHYFSSARASAAFVHQQQNNQKPSRLLKINKRQQNQCVNSIQTRSFLSSSSLLLLSSSSSSSPPSSGADIEQPSITDDEISDDSASSSSSAVTTTITTNTVVTANVPSDDDADTTAAATTTTGNNRPSSSSSSSTTTESSSSSRQLKVNEIDFCIAPADVSLSRSAISSSSSSSSSPTSSSIVSLTKYLNNASNRAVRRILLSRSWPSTEALNLSLRLVLAEAQKQKQQQQQKVTTTSSGDLETTTATTSNTAKCPVPRPILNILVGKTTANNKDDGVDDETSSAVDKIDESNSNSPRRSRGRTDEEYVKDQLETFRNTYGNVVGYDYAEAYLECILSLATSGKESNRIVEVLNSGIYDESYKRVLSVLQSVGVVFTTTTVDDDKNNDGLQLKQISSKLIDKDICLSMIDKITMKQEEKRKKAEGESFPSSTTTVISKEEEEEEDSDHEDSEKKDDEEQVVTKEIDNISDSTSLEASTVENDDVNVVSEQQQDDNEEAALVDDTKKKGKNRRIRLQFWKKRESDDNDDDKTIEDTSQSLQEQEEGEENDDEISKDKDSNNNIDSDIDNETTELSREDLGGVLLSSKEPSMTRQLNCLSNIVQRALLFGGNEELLVLSETLNADKPAFIQRWYPNTPLPIDGGAEKGDYDNQNNRPGLQYLDCLIELLRQCYKNGVVTTLESPLPLIPSYDNAYERLVASLVEGGSGYVKLVPGTTSLGLTKMPTPRTPKEELGRFAVWESTFRKSQSTYSVPDISAYPDDMIGTWSVRDEVGGKVIGLSTVVFKPNGEVNVELQPNMDGLRWRLDPGPTHLDTCTFQAVNKDDGTILQYRGFIDRGARLEARFSKRPITVRGSVMFQMRDFASDMMGFNNDDYYKDILPINYKTGTTKFVMTKEKSE